MASSSLTCISSALGDLQCLENLCQDDSDWKEGDQFLRIVLWGQENISPQSLNAADQLRILKTWLKILRTFLLCTEKWGNDDANLGALVVAIKDAISKTGQEIHAIYLTTVEDGFPKDVFGTVATGFRRDVKSFQQEIKRCYLALSDCLLRQSSNSLVKKDELVEFMDTLLENLRDVLRNRNIMKIAAVQKTKALEKELRFLKNFVCFVTQPDVEDRQLGPLLTHTGSAIIKAAYNCFLWDPINDPRVLSSTYNPRSVPLQDIIPVELQVHETFVQALIASKLSRQSYDEKDEHLLGDFIDFLLYNIWWILRSTSCRTISLRVQLQMVCEGLRSLRTILKKKPEKLYEKMRDLIGHMVCDAGVVIFSLRLNDLSGKEMDLVPFDLLESIKLLKAAVAEECQCPETSSFSFPRTNEMGFMDFLLEYMLDLTHSEAGLVTLANYPVQTIREELYDLHLFLGKIVELRNEDEELQAVWDRAIVVAYEVEFLIDSLMAGDNLDSSSMSFDSIIEEIKIIKAMAAKINFDSKRLHVKVEEVTRRLNHMPSQGIATIINDVVVGLQDEATSVVNRLTRGSQQVRIVPIVGMPGLGKTTLAKKVYNDSRVTSQFYMRAWCTVSQVFHKQNLLLEILTCFDPTQSNGFCKKNEEDLALIVKQRLQKNKYLIVLDDVWDIEVWNRLKASFPDDQNGSRVILTSRCRDVFPEPHDLCPLNHDQSWDLLKEKLYPGNKLPPPELCELRPQIVEMCQGLPLTIVILAGILAKKDKNGWKEVVENLSVVSSTEQCIATLDLSYKNLPDKLKPCFLYFGAFPEDHEHTIDRLIWLWVAEGFAQNTQVGSSKDMANAQKSHFKSLEDEANDNLWDLIERSLVTVTQQSSPGRVETCRIHDLLHEFCIRKAKEENFLFLVRGFDELYTTNVPHNLRRLCINCEQEDFYKSSLFAPTIRCLLFFSSGKRFQYKFRDSGFDASFIIGIFKLVRVLDLSQLYLGITFPRELELLAQLRYLAVLGDMNSIPSSIANLSNLETFIVETMFTFSVQLPDTIWNLKKLRHLQKKKELFGEGMFYLPADNLDNAAELCDLDTFDEGFLSLKHMDKIFSKFPNIRKMKFTLGKLQEDFDDENSDEQQEDSEDEDSEELQEDSEDEDEDFENEDSDDENSSGDVSSKILAFDSLTRLESLTFGTCDEFRCQFDFQFSSTIKELTLFGFGLPWSKISTIANLPNLEVLTLSERSFNEEIWNMEVERFPKLRFLKLAFLDIEKWTASECENCLPLLQKLVLQRCKALEEIPTSLGNVSTLEIIEVDDCYDPANLVQEIQEEYPDLQILISSS